MKKEPVVIVGFGWVGQANALALSILGHEVCFFDPAKPSEHYKKYEAEYKNLKILGSVLEKDSPETVYIVCVGDRVSENGEQDVSNIEKAVASLKGARGTIILRSTIRPDYLKRFKFHFYLPEFLHEKAGVEECLDPHYFVVGSRNNDRKEPSFFREWQRRSYRYLKCSPEEASHIKYLSNIWNSLRIAFVNEFGRTISADSEEAMTKEASRVLGFLFEDKPYLQFGRAFGGHCLPKDTQAYKLYASQFLEPYLLDGVVKANNDQLEFQENHPRLPEWFSPWRRVEMSGREALKTLGRITKLRLLGIFKPPK